jgi:hypothetical protein
MIDINVRHVPSNPDNQGLSLKILNSISDLLQEQDVANVMLRTLRQVKESYALGQARSGGLSYWMKVNASERS